MFESIADFVIFIWGFSGFALAQFSLLNLPFLAVFAAHRIVQIRDPQFGIRPSLPNHAIFGLLCAIVYGLLMPTFYFLTVRTRHRLGEWPLGADTNSGWTIALGVICIAWLAAHVWNSLTLRQRLRFGAFSWDWLFAALGLGLSLWFHAHVAIALSNETPSSGELLFLDGRFQGDELSLFVWHILPQSCFLGTTCVFGFALWESLWAQPSTVQRRWSRPALALASLFTLLLFAPFWLSIPRVSHREAMALITSHRDEILAWARHADLDPRLLAGIVYVAHTRDHPRLTGAALERFILAEWDKGAYFQRDIGVPLLDVSCGLFQIKPSTAFQTFARVMASRTDLLTPEQQQVVNYKWHLYTMEIPPLQLVAAKHTKLSDELLQPLRTAALGSEVPELLKNEVGNVSSACAMLVFLRERWTMANFPIADRPEILATLYNLGYERSKPKPNPRANDFGHRVAQFMHSPECLNLFPEIPLETDDGP